MPQDKLEQRWEDFVNSRTISSTSKSWIEFARAQLNLAAEIVARCPDTRVAVSEIRKLME